MPEQVTQLKQYLATARRTGRRNLDLVLLTAGANDIDFSGLVATSSSTHAERVLFAAA